MKCGVRQTPRPKSVNIDSITIRRRLRFISPFDTYFTHNIHILSPSKKPHIESLRGLRRFRHFFQVRLFNNASKMPSLTSITTPRPKSSRPTDVRSRRNAAYPSVFTACGVWPDVAIHDVRTRHNAVYLRIYAAERLALPDRHRHPRCTDAPGGALLLQNSTIH